MASSSEHKASDPGNSSYASSVKNEEYMSRAKACDTEDLPSKLMAIFRKHLALLDTQPEQTEATLIASTPLFSGSTWRQIRAPRGGVQSTSSMQYGLLGGSVELLGTGKDPKLDPRSDPRVFYNVTAPSSVFICGSQGSGKSHTLSCLLENCLVPSTASVLPKPLTGLVFHYDTFTSDTGGAPCEAAYLSSAAGVKVRVLCAPTNVRTIKRIYSHLPRVTVTELLIKESDLNTKRMLDLMAAGGNSMPLYLHVLNRILRDMRIEQQQKGSHFSYEVFKEKLLTANLTSMQLAPLQQRLDTLESFMPKRPSEQAAAGKKKKSSAQAAAEQKKNSSAQETGWTAKAGQLTIVDLSCPCVTAEMACSLFGICLSLFLEQARDIGRVVALDEAHKYMTESTESMALTSSLIETIRLQRHLGTRVIISTQEPSISPKLLDLCSVTIVHRFSSPQWLRTLQQHLAGVSSASHILKENSTDARDNLDVATLRVDATSGIADLFSAIVKLQVGEALVFAPSAIVGSKSTRIGTLTTDGVSTTEGTTSTFPDVVRLGTGIVKLRIRARVTTDGGRSVLAN